MTATTNTHATPNRWAVYHGTQYIREIDANGQDNAQVIGDYLTCHLAATIPTIVIPNDTRLKRADR